MASSRDRKTKFPVTATLASRLDALSPGTRVPILMMAGSLCPVTKAHVSMFVEARQFLRGEEQGPNVVLPLERPQELEIFSEVLACLTLNGDSYVQNKFRSKGEQALDFKVRHELTAMAVSEHDWLFLEPARQSAFLFDELKERWPELKFFHMDMNGADDVARYKKWIYNTGKFAHRYHQIVMPRGEHTRTCIDEAEAAGVDFTRYIVGPQLPGSVSSTHVRHMIRTGRLEDIRAHLHADVYEWHKSTGWNYQQSPRKRTADD